MSIRMCIIYYYYYYSYNLYYIYIYNIYILIFPCKHHEYTSQYNSYYYS